MSKKLYIKPAIVPIHSDLETPVLASSVVDNSLISSVGQEIGTEVEFEADSFVNTNWETGTN